MRIPPETRCAGLPPGGGGTARSGRPVARGRIPPDARCAGLPPEGGGTARSGRPFARRVLPQRRWGGVSPEARSAGLAPGGGGRSRTPAPAAQRGIALVLVLWITVMLTVMAGGFSYAMRNEALAAGNAIAIARVRAAADGAIERTAYELARPRLPDAWSPNAEPHAWQEDDLAIVAVATDETAKIDLNAASETLLRGLFGNVGGADADAAARLADAVIDWRDPDDLKRPNGAESADYAAAGAKTGPANAPFETVGEVARVLGMTPAIYSRVVGSLTVHSRQPGINPQTASREVLLALPGVQAADVDAYLATRDAALRARQPVPPFPGAQGLASGAIQTWRVRAQASLPDGVTFVREAVLRPSPDPARPLVVLAWLEGAAAPDAAADKKTDNDAARP